LARGFQSVVSAVCAAGVLFLASASVEAQTTARAERPYRGLFGGGAPAGAGHTLAVNASIGGGYDDNIQATLPNFGARIRRPVAGTLGTASASLNYSANLDRFSLGANAGTNASYYPQQGGALLGGYSAGLGLSAPVARRTTLGFFSSAYYMPYTFSSVIPVAEGLDAGVGSFGQPEPLPLELVTNDGEFLSYSAGVRLGHTFTQRLTGAANYSYTSRSSTLYNTPFSRQGFGAGMQYALGQGLQLTAGYQRMQGQYGRSSGDTTQDSINAGINYSRALSFSRRTTLGFGTGSTIVQQNPGNTRVVMTGNATLNHEVGRTWLATVGYSRGVRFVETLLEPVFQDSMWAGFGGLVNRRMSVQSSFRASLGSVGFGSDSANNGFDTYVGSVGTSVAITQHVSFGASYSIYRYTFEDAVVLPIGVPSFVHRQSVRAFISVWAPLLNTGRR
jgi:hypothetical protein